MIEIKNLTKVFPKSTTGRAALNNVCLQINDGDIYGIIGMSGAGKSTLVRCINMLERPTEGKIIIDGKDIGALSKKELCVERRNIAMIFQSFNLLMQRNCLDNICFPLELSGIPKALARKRAAELLETVGLPHKAQSYPAQLSGGQQQRIAIARALATEPQILLCDEATSALDPKTTHSILELIKDIHKKLGITVIVITHQMSVVEEICNRVAILDAGTVVEEGKVTDVFSNPHSEAGKRLVFPDESFDIIKGTNGRIVHVMFCGASAVGEPLITKMAIDEGITANILNASTKLIGDKLYGSMVLSLPNDGDTVERAMRYLSCENVVAEEVR